MASRSGQAPGGPAAVDPDAFRAQPRQVVAVPADKADRRIPTGKASASVETQPESGRSHWRWVIAGSVLLLVVVPIALWIGHQSGYVMSRNAMVKGQLAEIGTRLDGVVATVEVDAGQRVKAGQILARMDDRHARAEVQQAQAEVTGLERELEVERAAIIYEEQRLQTQKEEAAANLTAAAAQAEAAASRAEDARAFHEARQGLLPSGVISAEAVRDAMAKSRTAEAMSRAALAEYAAARSAARRAQLDSSGVAIRKQRVGVLESNVLRARARLAAAQADLESALIRAPTDGAVVRRIVQPGGSVKVGTPVMSLWLGDAVWVEAWLDEDDIAGVKVGSPAKVTLQSFPGREFSGVVEKIGLTTDFEMPDSEVPQPRFSRMRGAPVVGVGIRLEDAPPEMLPGLSAVAAIRKSDG